MSDDEALTKRAIEEILREASENTTQRSARLMENKINPLVKTNKNFLGRTVKSVMAHNKRHSERLMRNCRMKLKEMDMAKERTKRNEKQRQKERHRKKRYKYEKKRPIEEDNQLYETEYDYPTENYAYVDENTNYADVYYNLAQAALASHAYHQVGKWLCYQTLLSDTYKPQEKRIKIEPPSISLLSSDSDDSIDMTDNNIIDLTFLEEHASFNTHLEDDTIENSSVDCIDLSSDNESDTFLNLSSTVECQLLEIPSNSNTIVDISSDEDN